MTSVRPLARHRRLLAPLAIGLVGGNETAWTMLGPRLERDGHRVDVGRTALSRRQDVVLLLDPAMSAARRSVVVAALRARGTRVGIAVDGARALRHRTALRAAIRGADVLITSTRAAQDHLARRFGAAAELVPAGAAVRRFVPTDLLEAGGLVPRLFHLLVAPPERRDADAVVSGYLRSGARLPLVVVDRVGTTDRRAPDGRVIVLRDAGERLREQLAAHALVHLHGAQEADAGLLAAMGSATAVIARDTPGNREVVGTAGLFFRDPAELAERIREVERFPLRFRDIGELMQERIRARHEWDLVAERYGAIAVRLGTPRADRLPDPPRDTRRERPRTPAVAARPPG